MKKDAYYFSHDSNARDDEKIQLLRADYGWEGYGIFWLLVEMMFETAETALQKKNTRAIAVCNNIDITLLSNIINSAIESGLFADDGECYWSETLRRRKQHMNDSREARSRAGTLGMESRWHKQQQNNRTDNNVITHAITSNNTDIASKVNNKKERIKRKDNISTEIKTPYGKSNNVLLGDREYNDLISEYGKTVAELGIEKVSGMFAQYPKSGYTNKSHVNAVRAKLEKLGYEKLKPQIEIPQIDSPEQQEINRAKVAEALAKGLGLK